LGEAGIKSALLETVYAFFYLVQENTGIERGMVGNINVCVYSGCVVGDRI
jgi:hypothetical protein